MPNIIYPLDTVGDADTNFIEDEDHSLTEINDDTYRILIPISAPFYLTNFELYSVTVNNSETLLVEDIDYSFTLPFLGASRSIGKMIYGGISILNLNLNGSLKVSYQTLGGTWVANASAVLAAVTTASYNARIASWDVLTNVQETFPPTNHDINITELKGQEELIEAVNEINATILAGQAEADALLRHRLDVDNPHVTTKRQVGLGNVDNYKTATDSEALAGVSDTAFMTPLKTRNFIVKHIEDTKPIVQTWNITPNKTSVDEGGLVTFTIRTTNVPDSTAFIIHLNNTTADTDDFGSSYTIEGNTTGDTTTGLSVSIEADSITEGSESFMAIVTDSTGNLGAPLCQSTPVTIRDTSKNTVVASINQPSIIPFATPVGATTQTILASDFSMSPPGSSTHKNSHWQLSDRSDFNSSLDTQFLESDAIFLYVTKWDVVNLVTTKTYYVRVRFRSESGLESPWSVPFSFIPGGGIKPVNIARPVIVTPGFNTDNNSKIFRGKSDAFGVGADSGPDTLKRSEWQISTSIDKTEPNGFTNIFATNNSNTIDSPEMNLNQDTTYYVICRHVGYSNINSAWSQSITYKTKKDADAVIGNSTPIWDLIVDSAKHTMTDSKWVFNEGDTIHLLLKTTNVANATPITAWIGYNGADLANIANQNDVVVSQGQGLTTGNSTPINVKVTNDLLTEGGFGVYEVLSVAVALGHVTYYTFGTVVDFLDGLHINDTSLTPTLPSWRVTAHADEVGEGGVMTFVIATSGVPDKTPIFVWVDSMDTIASDFEIASTPGLTTGNLTFVSITARKDSITEGPERFLLSVATGSVKDPTKVTCQSVITTIIGNNT